MRGPAARRAPFLLPGATACLRTSVPTGEYSIRAWYDEDNQGDMDADEAKSNMIVGAFEGPNP